MASAGATPPPRTASRNAAALRRSRRWAAGGAARVEGAEARVRRQRAPRARAADVDDVGGGVGRHRGERREGEGRRLLHLDEAAAARILAEAARVADAERVAVDDADGEGAARLAQRNHPVDVLEAHDVAVLQAVRLLGHRHHRAVLGGADVLEQRLPRRLAVGVVDLERVAKVAEDGAEEPRRARAHEAAPRRAARRVERELLVERPVDGDDARVFTQPLGVEGPRRRRRHRDVRVERREPLRRAHGARRTDVLLAQQEARREVGERRRRLVVHVEAGDAGEHQVLRHLGAEPAQPEQQHRARRERALRLVAKHVQLPAVEALVDVVAGRLGSAAAELQFFAAWYCES